jgi:hypothetical protein
MCRNMFLHFYGKYNMILFVLKILDRMQIKIFNSFFFNIYKTYIKKKYKHTQPLFIMFYTYTYKLKNNNN